MNELREYIRECILREVMDQEESEDLLIEPDEAGDPDDEDDVQEISAGTIISIVKLASHFV